MTPLEDQLYLALMGAKQLVQRHVRADTREWDVLSAVDKALNAYQKAKTLPPPDKVEQPMDWDAVKEIRG